MSTTFPPLAYTSAPPQQAAVLDARSDLYAYAEALRHVARNLNQNFGQALEILLACRGKVILVALGKSGHVARKAAATLSSTGTPAIFLNASEALHGDLGIVTANDVAILISHSGETPEVRHVGQALQRRSVPIIAIAGRPTCSLAAMGRATIVIDPGPERCHLGVAPTTSTIAQLAVLDALAMAASRAKNFTREQFAEHHPGGSLGRMLQHAHRGPISA